VLANPLARGKGASRNKPPNKQACQTIRGGWRQTTGEKTDQSEKVAAWGGRKE